MAVTLASVWDAYAERYDEIFSRPRHHAENRVVVDRVRGLPCVRHGEPVLDIGCGTGLLIDCLPLENFIGIDISPAMIAKAKEKHPSYDWRVMDMQDLSSFPDGAFGAVVSLFAAFNYALSPLAAFREVTRVLRPGGDLFLHVLAPPMFLRMGQHTADMPLRVWTVQAIKELCRSEGVELVSLVGMTSILRLPWVRFESATIGRVAPWACEYLLVTGRKI
jgi:ubiquinone/menaquinone biosynthesis C-methylase UbiE